MHGQAKIVIVVVFYITACAYKMALGQTTNSFETDLQKGNSTKPITINDTSNPATLQPTQALTARPPQPTVSQETYDRLMKIMSLFNVVFEAVSVVLTFTSACVYALPSMRCATACYLVALNLADTVSGLLVVIMMILGSTAGTEVTTSATYQYFLMLGPLLVSVSCRRMVYCLSAMVSLERFFVIAFPLKARYTKLLKYPKISVAVMGVAVFVLHVYLIFQFDVVPVSRGVGYAVINSGAFKANEDVFDGLSNAAKFVSAYIPLVMCLVLSVALMVALRRHAASRQALQEGKEDGKGAEARSTERQLAMTILVSTLLYTLLSLPSNTSQLVATYHSTFRFMGLEHRLYTLTGRFTNVALIASRYTNFLAYFGLSVNFRRNLLRLLCPRKLMYCLTGGTRTSGRHTGSATVETSKTAVCTVMSDYQ